MIPDLWRFRKIDTENYPVGGTLGAHAAATRRFDLKKSVQREVISQLLLRVRGNIVKAGTDASTATGRENPEALIQSVTLRTSPSIGVIPKNSLSARGTVLQGIFDRGYAIRAADIDDAAATVGIDFVLPVIFQMPLSVLPIEWSLPMIAFETAEIEIVCGGRERLFTGGANKTWDLTGLQIEVWADYQDGIQGAFHVWEEFEQEIPVTQTQSDLRIELAAGFYYTHLMFMSERDNVLVNDIVNSITVRSAGREWTPQGDNNAAMIQRWNRERYVNNAAEVLTGVYFIGALRDGMFKRSLEMLQAKPDIRLDVTLGGGTTRRVILRGRRIAAPNGLKFAA